VTFVGRRTVLSGDSQHRDLVAQDTTSIAKPSFSPREADELGHANEGHVPEEEKCRTVGVDAVALRERQSG
jgi:hypothetical protein